MVAEVGSAAWTRVYHARGVSTFRISLPKNNLRLPLRLISLFTLTCQRAAHLPIRTRTFANAIRAYVRMRECACFCQSGADYHTLTVILTPSSSHPDVRTYTHLPIQSQ